MNPPGVWDAFGGFIYNIRLTMLEIGAIYDPVMKVVEVLGTVAFFVSGIRQAAAKHFDWFGGFVCGIAVAVGGGTLRDVLLGVTPFWMTNPFYLICCIAVQAFVICFPHLFKKLNNAWFLFDTLGLALFSIAGLQKSLDCGYSFWVAIIMGCITGSAGGVIRDIFLNDVPVIFQKEIYAMASIVGGAVYWLLVTVCGINIIVAASVTFVLICAIRFWAVYYHVSLPSLRSDEDDAKN